MTARLGAMVAEQLPASEGAMGAMFKGVERDRGIAHLHDVRGHTFRPKALVGRIEALLVQSGDGAAPAVGTILRRGVKLLTWTRARGLPNSISADNDLPRCRNHLSIDGGQIESEGDVAVFIDVGEVASHSSCQVP